MTVDRLRDLLGAIGPAVTPTELAEMIWLARYLPTAGRDTKAVSLHVGAGSAIAADERDSPIPAGPALDQRQPLYPLMAPPEGIAGSDAEPVLVPTAPMLRHPLAIQRGLRLLKRRVAARDDKVLDEHATAVHIAQRWGERPWIPVMAPATERWLSLAIVMDTGPAMGVWGPLGSELCEAMLRLGAFRDVRLWLVADVSGSVGVRASPRGPALGRPLLSIRLVDKQCSCSLTARARTGGMAEWGPPCPCGLVAARPR